MSVGPCIQSTLVFFASRQRFYGTQDLVPSRFRRSPARPLRKVRGGRWNVRKLEWASDERVWKVWSKGAASRHSARFKTHQEAVRWALLVSWVYSARIEDRVDLKKVRARVQTLGWNSYSPEDLTRQALSVIMETTPKQNEINQGGSL